MDKGLEIHPLTFLAGNDVVAAACLRKTRSDELIAGVLIRSADGLFRERIDVIEGEISGMTRSGGSWTAQDRDPANDRRPAAAQQRWWPASTARSTCTRCAA